MATITETTDAPGDRTTPYVLGPDDVFLGTLSRSAVDWVAVTLVAGHSYSFGAVGVGAAGSGVTDPLLRLYGADGAVLALDDDGGPGFGAALHFTATTSGVHYIEVKSIAGATEGAYGLAMAKGSWLSYGADLGAAILYRDGSSWADAAQTGVSLSWGLRAAGPGLDASGNPAPFQMLTTAQTAAAMTAMANFADVAQITFVRADAAQDGAQLLLGGYTSATDGAGAHANLPGDTADAGDIWINTHHVSGTSLPTGSYGYFILLHELGHALGLDHPGDYNAAPGGMITYADAAQFMQDSQQFTVMSYFAATVTEASAPPTYPDTLMMYDILAIQALYGVNLAMRSGDDTYGFGSDLGGAYDFTVNRDPLLCIWDGGGIDTLNLSRFDAAQRIDLRAGAFSDVGGFRGNLSIAPGVVIEHALGGRGGDSLKGNAAANGLRGGRGQDTLSGGAGRDRLTGDAGADHFVFGVGGGRDRVLDFTPGQDVVSLSADLWGGTSLTPDQVIQTYARLHGGHVVLTFGEDRLTLLGATSRADLDGHILLT